MSVYPTCPICLDGLKHALLFTCHHFACSACAKEHNSSVSPSVSPSVSSSVSSSASATAIYKVKPKETYRLKFSPVLVSVPVPVPVSIPVLDKVICPICNELVGCQLADWLDTPHDLEEMEDSEEMENSKPMDSEEVSPKCPLGFELIEKSSKLETLVKPAVDYSSSIIAERDQELVTLDQELKRTLERIQLAHQAKVDKLKRQTEARLDREASRAKQHDHATQSIEHMSLTLKSLARQTPKVIEQFLTQFQPKLAEFMFPWPLGITPAYPDAIFDSPCMAYVSQLQDFVYYQDGFIILGPHKTAISEVPTTMNISTDLIFVSHICQNSCDSTVTTRTYDFSLVEKSANRKKTYGKVVGSIIFGVELHLVKIRSDGVSVGHYVVSGTFNDDTIRYVHVEFIGGFFYTGTPFGVIACKKARIEHERTTVSSFTHLFAKDGVPRFYKHEIRDEEYFTILDLGAETMTLPGKGHFYPGALDSILYKCGKHCKLLFVQFPPFKVPQPAICRSYGN